MGELEKGIEDVLGWRLQWAEKSRQLTENSEKDWEWVDYTLRCIAAYASSIS